MLVCIYVRWNHFWVGFDFRSVCLCPVIGESDRESSLVFSLSFAALCTVDLLYSSGRSFDWKPHPENHLDRVYTDPCASHLFIILYHRSSFDWVVVFIVQLASSMSLYYYYYYHYVWCIIYISFTQNNHQHYYIISGLIWIGRNDLFLDQTKSRRHLIYFIFLKNRGCHRSLVFL